MYTMFVVNILDIEYLFLDCLCILGFLRCRRVEDANMHYSVVHRSKFQSEEIADTIEFKYVYVGICDTARR